MNTYLSIKALHLLFVISWFAGLFYIFRLFVYHAKEKANEDVCRVLSIMETKLMRIVMFPASVIVLLTGSLLLYLNPILLKGPWMHIKLLSVLGLLLYQEFARQTKNRFYKKDFYMSERQCRFINEVPTLFLILILFMVFLRPFG